ncbi:hypothetical protein B296_00016654 [Ensete ventricosum]|uniref:Uncharacterized protein n=1 Tax=Ensete ventricosum TaxID=4639 RepID=A0A427AQT0_ENSVE|nr:hypothetical protein B296_00016654 [Ensete ventricosum]
MHVYPTRTVSQRSTLPLSGSRKINFGKIDFWHPASTAMISHQRLRPHSDKKQSTSAFASFVARSRPSHQPWQRLLPLELIPHNSSSIIPYLPELPSSFAASRHNTEQGRVTLSTATSTTSRTAPSREPVPCRKRFLSFYLLRIHRRKTQFGSGSTGGEKLTSQTPKITVYFN